MPVGQQQQGDIGIIRGASDYPAPGELYLVVEVRNGAEMIIADGRLSEPHRRFASRSGRTPTQYFLRPCTTSSKPACHG